MKNPNYEHSKWRQLIPESKAVKGSVERHQRNGGCLCESVSHNTSVLSRAYYCDSCGDRIQ